MQKQKKKKQEQKNNKNVATREINYEVSFEKCKIRFEHTMSLVSESEGLDSEGDFSFSLGSP